MQSVSNEVLRRRSNTLSPGLCVGHKSELEYVAFARSVGSIYVAIGNYSTRFMKEFSITDGRKKARFPQANRSRDFQFRVHSMKRKKCTKTEARSNFHCGR